MYADFGHMVINWMNLLNDSYGLYFGHIAKDWRAKLNMPYVSCFREYYGKIGIII